MIIAGVQKSSFVDYPNHVCTTLFTKGCQFRCPFCHNSDLIINNDDNYIFDEEKIINMINSRRTLVDHVCISGGEPLLQTNIIEFIHKLTNIGIKIKLDTNGYNFNKLEEVINTCDIDYIAMDIKNTKKRYTNTVGRDKINIYNIDKSINIIMRSNIDYEFRTTVIGGLHSDYYIIDIAKWIQGAKKYTIQNYKFSENVLDPSIISPFKKEALEFVVNEINDKKYVKECILNTYTN